ncbi:MAG TPA: 3-hydroxyacyl-ACP dehydratase [Chitinophagaceae bacterium]|jgi:predicted hotdog family 3-hydroxylacyl-ACP dehydratase|nr:3-hydroxyacyl-ACP dehydratase [Chitinophagaceae bacterium]
MITTGDIQSLIPQRPPFVMVDQLLSFTETTAHGGFTIKADNIFLENGEFKEPGLLENIAQTAAARAGYISKKENKPVPIGYIGSVKNLEIYSFPKAGDELITEITIENQIFDVTIISGKVSCNEKLLAQCQIKIFIDQTKNRLL